MENALLTRRRIQELHRKRGADVTLNDRYEVQAKLDEGGMGAVYLAHDLRLPRDVAIKVIKPEYTSAAAQERLRREAHMLAQLAHSNIVQVLDFSESDNRLGLFFVMEYVKGVNFGKLLANCKLVERLTIIAEICKGLAYIHSHDLVHRDLKPENVLVSVTGDVKLADLGLGRAIEDESRLTREGTTVGSVHYMAPEQGCGRPIDCRTDLYSVGVMLYRAATGTIPFIGRQHEVISQHLNAQPTPPRQRDASVPEELENLVLRLLEKDPARRPQSAEAVHEELERLIAAYWPIISRRELRTTIGAKASLIATQPRRSRQENVQATPRSPGPVLTPTRPPRLTSRCSKCGCVIRIDSEQSGKTLRCPACESKVRVPAVTTDKTPALAVGPAQPESHAERIRWDDLLAEAVQGNPTAPASMPANGPARARGPKRSRVRLPAAKLARAALCLVLLIGGGGYIAGSLSNVTPKPKPVGTGTSPRNSGSIVPAIKGKPQITLKTNVPAESVLVNGDSYLLTNRTTVINLDPGRYEFVIPWGVCPAMQKFELGEGQAETVNLTFTPRDISDTYREAVCLIRTPLEGSYGSGFLVRDRQTIVTAAHVLDDARTTDDLEFVFNPTCPPKPRDPHEEILRGARVIYYDRLKDLAILQLNEPAAAHRQPLPLQSSTVVANTRVTTIGNGVISDDEFQPLEVRDGMVASQSPLTIQFVNVREGFSGGPVFTGEGAEGVGVISARMVLSRQHNEYDLLPTVITVPWSEIQNALAEWDRVDEQRRQRFTADATDKFENFASRGRVFELSLRILVTSYVSYRIADGAAVDALKFWEPIARERGPQYANAMLKKEWNVKEKPRIVAEVKSKYTPLLEKYVDGLYREVQQDTRVMSSTQSVLKTLWPDYLELKKAAEELDEKATAEEFRYRIKKTIGRLIDNAMPVVEQAEKALERSL